VDLSDPAKAEVFFDIHRDLPREGPGSRSCTRRALELASPLPRPLRVLDIGCGPGMQTLDLALLLPRATITAVDLHAGFVEETRRRVQDNGFADRVKVQQADMTALPFAAGSFDLIWCEGAAYIMGVTEALQRWAPLLRSSYGRIAFTEMAWLRDDVPSSLRKGWERDYPAMTDVAGCRARIEQAGLDILGDFVLPESAWWNDYYGPLEARLDQLEPKYAGNAVAAPILAMHRDELAMFREFSSYYGYVFFVLGR